MIERLSATLVFDREGYSPSFFAEMKTRRIAILSYHKFPGEPWPQSEFGTHKVTLVHGEEVDMELAERGVCLSNGMWVREIQQRSQGGTQSSILCSDYRSEATRARRPACSHGGVRKTSSNTCESTTILTA
jgi:hypothetical protein